MKASASLSWRGVIAILLLFGAAALAGGFLLGASNFASNLLAEAFGFVVAVVLGVLVFDRLDDRRREQTWRRVRQQVLEAVHGHLVGFVSRCWLESKEMPMKANFFEPLTAGQPSVADTAIASVESVAKRIRELGSAGNKDDVSLPTRKIYEASRWDVSQVADVLTTRVIELSSDTCIVERLLEFAKAIRRWELARYLEDSEERTGSNYVGEIAWEPIAEAVDATAAIFLRINETYKK